MNPEAWRRAGQHFIAILICDALAFSLASSQGVDTAQVVTSPGCNLTMSVPPHWRFVTSVEQQRDSVSLTGTLAGTFASPDSGTVVFVERMNTTHPASDLRRRIDAAGIDAYARGVADSIVGHGWEVDSFVVAPEFRKDPLLFSFIARLRRSNANDSTPDGGPILRFSYRKAGGVDLRIHSISSAASYMAYAEDVGFIERMTRPIVEEDDATLREDSSDVVLVSADDGSTEIVVIALCVAVVGGVIGWRMLRRSKR